MSGIIGPAEQIETERQSIEDVKLATARGEHVWVATMAYRVDPSDPVIRLTDDTRFAGPAVQCFICEQDYRPHLVTRPCPGDPSGLMRDMGPS